jgi:heme-degrading monooxygenase HmoA
MLLVSITRLRVRSFRYLPVFLLGSLRSAREAKNASGNLAVSVLSDANLTFWTRTLWTDERSMRAFMFAPAHRRVMPKLLQWCDEAAVTHWLQETPSWQEVHRRLQQEGRTSKVDHPSAAQLRFEIPPPKTTRQLTLKSPPRASAGA